MMGDALPLGLGSNSPRRRELLEALGLPIRVLPAQADESVLADDVPVGYLERVVANKLVAVLAKHRYASVAGWLVADTTVVVDGHILGKPADLEHARQMLKRLSGRGHEVFSRFAVCRLDAGGAPGETLAETVRTAVWFRALSGAEIDGYARSGEGFDKAGAYAIQGLGSFAVERIEGSYTNVVGLPVCEVVLALRRIGLLGTFP